MALRQRLNEQARVVRRVSVGDDLLVTVDTDVGDWLPAEFVTPTDEQPTDSDSPRGAVPPTLIRYAHGFKSLAGDAPLSAGARVERRGGGEYELLASSRHVLRGTLLEGYEAPALPLDVIYPASATVQALGGAVVANSVPIAVWGGTDRREDAGQYEDLSGEAPVEYAVDLVTNHHLLVGGRKLRIIESVIDYVGPRVKLELRRPGG
jgi:hypothetical protein